MIDAGRCLRLAQNDLGVASVEVAKRTGSTPQQVVRWRSQENMKLHTVEMLAKALDLSVYDFLLYDNLDSPR
ncbi:MAG: helix-turn-helix domain-containing protein [Thalassobaculaceae bacterium]